MEFRARHAVEPWRPEANYVARLKEDLHKLIAEVRRMRLAARAATPQCPGLEAS